MGTWGLQETGRTTRKVTRLTYCLMVGLRLTHCSCRDGWALLGRSHWSPSADQSHPWTGGSWWRWWARSRCWRPSCCSASPSRSRRERPERWTFCHRMSWSCALYLRKTGNIQETFSTWDAVSGFASSSLGATSQCYLVQFDPIWCWRSRRGQRGTARARSPKRAGTRAQQFPDDRSYYRWTAADSPHAGYLQRRSICREEKQDTLIYKIVLYSQ